MLIAFVFPYDIDLNFVVWDGAWILKCTML